MRKAQLILIIFLTIAIRSFAADDCTGDIARDRDENLDCLIRMVNQPIKEVKDWERFWKIYNIAEKDALSCDSLTFTVNFLKISTYHMGTGTDEVYSKTVGQLLQTQTSCFFDAVLMLNDNQRHSVITKLVPPVSIAEQKTVDNIFKKKSGVKKYQEITNIYNEIRNKHSNLE